MVTVIDTSPWNAIKDWSVADAFIFCASWTRGIEADRFAEYWTSCPTPRGAFFAQYFDGSLSSGQQARRFADILKRNGGVRSGDRLFTDVEVGQLNLKQIIDFLYNLELELGRPAGVRYGIYSRRDLLDPLRIDTLSHAQRETLKSYDIWIAGHPTKLTPQFPPPAVYQPTPGKYGEVILWQYWTDGNPKDLGIDDKIDSGVDLNSVDPEYFSQWVRDSGITPPPPAETTPPTQGDEQMTNLVKATARQGTISNVKPIAGGSEPIDYLHGGDSVVGQDVGTDIYGFTEITRADGGIVKLPQECKVTKANIATAIPYQPEPQPEPEPEPQPDPQPPAPEWPATITVALQSDDGAVTYSGIINKQ